MENLMVRPGEGARESGGTFRLLWAGQDKPLPGAGQNMTRGRGLQRSASLLTLQMPLMHRSRLALARPW